jgi:branched-chain amino acid transport system substrate-binding protein
LSEYKDFKNPRKEAKRVDKKLLLVSLALFLVILVAAIGCPAPPSTTTPPKTTTPPPTTQPEIPSEIRIGDVVSYTGPYAGFGFNIYGVEAAVEDINKEGGIYVEEYGAKIPVRYITVDCASDPLKVAALTEDLILREKIQFIGPALEVPTMRQGTATMAEKYKIPSVYGVGPFESWMAMKESAGATWSYSFTYGPGIAAPRQEGDFRAGDPGYLMMPTWFGALDAFADQTNRKVACFALDDADGRAWYMTFVEAAEGEGYDCYRAEDQFGIFPGDITDFSPIIEEWKSAGCDILWGNCPGPHYGILWKQCHVLGFEPKMVFSTRAAMHYSDISAWGGDLPHGVGAEIYWAPTIQGAVGIGGTTPQSLADRWYEAKGEPLTQGVGYQYAAAQVLFGAIERAGTLDSDAVLKAISETDVMTMTGRFAFEKGTQFHAMLCALAQWRETDNPWVWENPIVFSYNEDMPATAEMIFPMPYD